MSDPIARRRARRGVVPHVEPSSAPWRVLEPVEPEAPDTGQPHAIPWVAVLGIAVVAVLAVGAIALASHADPVVGVDGAIGVDGGSGSPASWPSGSASAPGSGVVVEVGGAVARPGVYRLPAGSRVGDAIAAAGGYAPAVDAIAAGAQLNLAAVLHDAEKIHVPGRGEPAASGAGGGTGASVGPGASAAARSPLDLNTATAAELDALPGIGPVTAAKILAAREQRRFATVDDLVSRKVIGSATLDKIRLLVTVSP
jgi:competence protein ComEA